MAIGAGAFIIVATVLITAARYRDLPERIPIHFGINGVADNYGPRYMIWLLVLVQLVTAASYAIVFANGRWHGWPIIGDALLAICLLAQLQIISAAISGKDRINVLGFWILFGAIIAVSVAATRLK